MTLRNYDLDDLEDLNLEDLEYLNNLDDLIPRLDDLYGIFADD